MVRRIATALALCLLAPLPGLAQTALPCRLGPHAKNGHVLLEGIDSTLRPAGDRAEFVLRLRNPWPWPVAIQPGIELTGVVEASAVPVMLSPRGAARITLGWVPLDVAPRPPVPGVHAVRAALSLPFCVVMAPGLRDAPPIAAGPQAPADPA